MGQIEALLADPHFMLGLDSVQTDDTFKLICSHFKYYVNSKFCVVVLFCVNIILDFSNV